MNNNDHEKSPERLARAYLKNKKKDGGINGVDIEAFHSGIILRQNSKGLKNSWLLKELTPILGRYDHVAIQCYKVSNKIWRSNSVVAGLNGHNDIEKISGLAVSDVINNNTQAYAKAMEYNLITLKDLQDAKHRRTVNRGQLNKITKGLPPIIKN